VSVLAVSATGISTMQAARVGRHLRYDPDRVRAWFREQAA
jgi:hypothetical protein